MFLANHGSATARPPASAPDCTTRKKAAAQQSAGKLDFMYFAYVDESGDSGPTGSRSFSLGCVLVEHSAWPQVFDNFIDFRRFLRARFGVPVRGEIKANHLIRNGGVFRQLALSESARFAIYRAQMRLLPKLGMSAFAVLIRKDLMQAEGRVEDPREVAWEYLLQRLERFTTYSSTHAMLVHDEGYADRIRAMTRKARRAGGAGSMFGTGFLRLPARLIIDDPVSRHSDQSYFLQAADLVAYAAFRRYYPPPPGPRRIVPTTMWDELGTGILWQVNRNVGGPPGIVVWPRT
jgi:hypothetical protein